MNGNQLLQNKTIIVTGAATELVRLFQWHVLPMEQKLLWLI